MADHFRVAAVSYHGCDVGRSSGSRRIAACENNDRTNETVSGLVDLI